MSGVSVSKNNIHLRRQARLFYLYVSPWIVGFALFTLVPMVMSLVFAFSDASMVSVWQGIDFIGFKNFIDIFTRDPDFLVSIRNTFVFAGLRVFFGTLFALLIALLLNGNVFGKKIFRTLIYMPAVIPVVSVALLWRLIFTGDSMNIANYILSLFGLGSVNFFGSAAAAMLTVVFVSVWGGLGPTMLILLATLQGIPQDILDAARIDGAGAFRRFWNIVLPTISATLFFVVLTGLIGGLQAYAEIKLLTDGGPGISTVTMNMLIVRNAFNSMGRKTLGYASAQGWIVFALVMALTVVFVRISSRKVYYEGK
jgi:multiple sugar transport system permease protein